MKALGLSGSLRAASTNTGLLRAMRLLAPSSLAVELYPSLGDLPLFNPDLETRIPDAVARFRSAVEAADALLIASPEYAHGVTGTIKNALDWLVSFEAFVYKPVVVLNASPRAHHADAALRETLRTMSAIIVEEASISVPLLGARLSEDDIVRSETIARDIRTALVELRDFLEHRGKRGPAFPLL